MHDDRSEFAIAVLAVVESIPTGEVLSYGDVAAEAGFPGAARGVGSVLRASTGTPWWRVISASGRVTTPNPERQMMLLTGEGWHVDRLTRKVVDRD